MSFLRMNGYVAPVASLEELPREIGSRGKAVDGTELVDRIGYVREWICKTPPVSAAETRLLRGLLRGDGDVWPFDSDVYSSKGRNAEGSPQYNLVSAADGAETSGYQFGGGVYISESSTNILAQNARNGDEAGDQSSFSTTGTGSLATSTTHYWQGTHSLQVTTGAGVNAGARTAAAAVIGGVIYVGSVYIKIPSGAAKSLTLALVGDVGGTLDTVVKSVPADGEWHRLELPVTADIGDSTIYLWVYEASGTSATWYMDGLQVEANSNGVATAWVDGARASNDVLSYDATDGLASMFLRDWSMCFWVSMGNTNDFGAADQMLISVTDDPSGPSDRILVYATPTGTQMEFGVTVSTGDQSNDTGEVTATGAERTIFHIAIVFRYSPEAGESRLTLYVDGSESDTDSSGSGAVNASALTSLEIGSTGDGTSDHLNGIVDDLMIVPYAMSAAQVAALYASGVASPQLPKVYVDGDFIDDDAWTILAIGELGKAEQVVVNGENNWRILQFTLVEAALQP